MIPHAPISPRLLWVDLTHDQSGPECMAAFAGSCQVTLVRDLSVSSLSLLPAPDMICMHYDRPDAVGLDLLLQVKRATPSTPITMLTMQHSEELAVWAFRSGAWEYLTLPLQGAELKRYLQVLFDICQLRRGSPRPEHKRLLKRPNTLPESVRLTAQYQRQQPLLEAVHYIEAHFNEHIEQKTVAEQCGMTPFRFSRLFKQTYGIGFLEFIQRKRMEKAEELLCNSQMPVTSIAYAVGFQDPSYFTRAFKQYFGCCPSQLRQEELPASRLQGTATRYLAEQ